MGFTKDKKRLFTSLLAINFIVLALTAAQILWLVVEKSTETMKYLIPGLIGFGAIMQICNYFFYIRKYPEKYE